MVNAVQLEQLEHSQRLFEEKREEEKLLTTTVTIMTFLFLPGTFISVSLTRRKSILPG
jgi:hypothetical protein